MVALIKFKKKINQKKLNKNLANLKKKSLNLFLKNFNMKCTMTFYSQIHMQSALAKLDTIILHYPSNGKK